VVPIYGWLAHASCDPAHHHRHIVLYVTARCVLRGGRIGLREGLAFYIWIGLLNVFIVSQFWQFANDLFTEAQAAVSFHLSASGSRWARGWRRVSGAARRRLELHAVHADADRRLRAARRTRVHARGE